MDYEKFREEMYMKSVSTFTKKKREADILKENTITSDEMKSSENKEHHKRTFSHY